MHRYGIPNTAIKSLLHAEFDRSNAGPSPECCSDVIDQITRYIIYPAICRQNLITHFGGSTWGVNLVVPSRASLKIKSRTGNETIAFFFAFWHFVPEI